jgi:hypothetical protein
MYIGLHVKYRLFLSNFSWNLCLFDRFSKTSQVSNFIEIRTLGPNCSMRTGEHDEGNSPLSQFCGSASKRVLIFWRDETPGISTASETEKGWIQEGLRITTVPDERRLNELCKNKLCSPNRKCEAIYCPEKMRDMMKRKTRIATRLIYCTVH